MTGKKIKRIILDNIKTLMGALLVIISTLIIFRREIYKKKIITSRPINE